jgi:hypothetical protein
MVKVNLSEGVECPPRQLSFLAVPVRDLIYLSRDRYIEREKVYPESGFQKLAGAPEMDHGSLGGAGQEGSRWGDITKSR